MTLALVIIAAIGYILAAGFAFAVGRDWWDARALNKRLGRAIVERDEANNEYQRFVDSLAKAEKAKLAKAEKAKLEALELIGRMKTEMVEAGKLNEKLTEAAAKTEATRVRQIEEMALDMTRMESECIALRLKDEATAKEKKQWQAACEMKDNELESARNERNKILVCVREAISKLRHVAG